MCTGKVEIYISTSLCQVKLTRLTCWLGWLVGKNKFTFTWRNEDKWKSGSTLMMCSGCCMYCLDGQVLYKIGVFSHLLIDNNIESVPRDTIAGQVFHGFDDKKITHETNCNVVFLKEK